jgi:hypothetical protein
MIPGLGCHLVIDNKTIHTHHRIRIRRADVVHHVTIPGVVLFLILQHRSTSTKLNLLVEINEDEHDSTASRPLSEVKHVRAWLVLRWGTTLESQVLFSF